VNAQDHPSDLPQRQEALRERPTSQTLRLRNVGAEDLQRVLELEHACFRTPWPASAFAVAFAAPDLLFLGAYDDDLLGYVVAAPTINETVLIANLGVDPGARRRGVASALIDAVLDWSRIRGAAACRLDVRKSNAQAIALYQRFGFRTDGVQRSYYSHPREDALSMSMSLRSD
jgi:ribosomal-protein-alanine N-acetyltransferase